MKKMMSLFIALSMLSAQSFGFGRDEELDDMIKRSSRTTTICHKVQESRDSMYEKMVKVNVLKDQLKEAKRTNVPARVLDVSRKLGVAIAALGAGLVATSRLYTKVKYGHYFFEVSGLGTAAFGVGATVLGAKIAIIAQVGYELSDSDIEEIEEELSKVESEVRVLKAITANCG